MIYGSSDLNKLFDSFFKYDQTQSPAWRTVTNSSQLTDEEYEKTLQVIEFRDINQLKKLTNMMKPLGKMYEVYE